jgi:hypothetical protein
MDKEWKITTDDLLHLLKEPFSLTPEHREAIFDALDSDPKLQEQYEVLLEKFGTKS